MTELLVVVTIIGLLALLTALSLKPWLQLARSRDTRRKTDIKIISDALESYSGDHPCYPTEEVVNVCGGDGLKPYLNRIPCDPLTNQPYNFVRVDNCKQYALYANLEVKTDNDYGVGNYAVTSGNLGSPPIYNRPTPTLVGPTPTSIGPTPTSVEPTPTDISRVATPTPWSYGVPYACWNGSCLPIQYWDASIESTCQPSYQSSTCYSSCSGGANNYSCPCKIPVSGYTACP